METKLEQNILGHTLHNRLHKMLQGLTATQTKIAKEFWDVRFDYAKISEMSNSDVLIFIERLERLIKTEV